MLHPKVAFRDCRFCRDYAHDEKSGLVILQNNKPMPRDKMNRCLCETHKGCPKGNYDEPIELSPKNIRALHHYKQCQAMMRFPDDSIVQRNAGIIFEAEESVARVEAWKTRMMLEMSLSIRPVG